MPSSLKDNRPKRGSVGEFLRDQIKPEAKLSFVSAYFTVNAYDALKTTLEAAGHLRFLFGEPSFVSEIDSDKQARKNFRLTEDGLELAHSLAQRPVARACAAWIDRMVEIRSIRQSGFLHGKAYHIQNGNASSAILGSSNFTVPGLGLRATGNNIELNLVVDSDRDRHDLLAWFDEVWGDEKFTKDVKAGVLRYLERLYANHSPEFIYYLTLFHIFRDELEGAEDIDDTLRRTTLLESSIGKTLFSFQKDGVKGAINKILAYNGCILADSVGLGKTFEALAVIKYFELRNERVLVICPKKLRQNWTVYRSNSRLNPLLDDGLAYDVLSHTDLSREGVLSGDIDLANLNWGNYGLIVIDESHNFRNNAVGKEKEDGSRRRSRYERLMADVIQSGMKTKVLLLSATPVNNQIVDIRNQISLIAGGDVARSEDPAFDAAFREKLGVPSVKETARQAQGKFTTWTKKPPAERKARDLIHQLGSDFFKLLDGLSIARSRSQIKRYYAKELASLGGFPERTKPAAEYPEIDALGKFLTFQQLDEKISSLTLSLYHPSSYLRDDLPESVREQYAQRTGNFTQEGRERILISMMKVNFLKRLESSIDDLNLTTNANSFSKNVSSIKLYRGRNIHRYNLEESVSDWVNHRQFADKAKRNSEKTLLVCQEITGTVDPRRLIFALIHKPNELFLFGHTVQKIILKDQSLSKVVLAILNSKLMDWCFRKTSTNNHVGGYELEALPFPSTISTKSEKIRSTLVDCILASMRFERKDLSAFLEDLIDACVMERKESMKYEGRMIKGSSASGDFSSFIIHPSTLLSLLAIIKQEGRV